MLFTIAKDNTITKKQKKIQNINGLLTVACLVVFVRSDATFSIIIEC